MEIPSEVDDLVRGSGNNFHAKVARWFKENKWHVVVSPYYMDQSQNKAREIDLVAEKLYPTRDPFGRVIGHVAVRLFIECKFVPQTSVFWFSYKDHASALGLVCSDAVFPKDNSHTKSHHYLSQSDRVAKLFATSTSKTNENEPFYKALNQVISAMVSMRETSLSSPQLRQYRNAPTAILEFPIVVCSSFEKVYSVDFDSESKPERITNNFQLEVRYAYVDRKDRHRDEYFLLDFVDFNKLEEFVVAIDADANAAVQLS